MAVVSVSLPEDLLSAIDEFAAERGYGGRSELVRAAMRDFLHKEASSGGEGQRSATLTIVYEEGHERRVGEVRHQFTDVVRSMMHGHADHMCVEVFMLHGPGRRVREFSDSLRAARSVVLVELTWTDRAAGVGSG